MQWDDEEALALCAIYKSSARTRAQTRRAGDTRAQRKQEYPGVKSAFNRVLHTSATNAKRIAQPRSRLTYVNTPRALPRASTSAGTGGDAPTTTGSGTRPGLSYRRSGAPLAPPLLPQRRHQSSDGCSVTRSAESDSGGSAAAAAAASDCANARLPSPSASYENRVDWVSVGVAETIGRRPTMEDRIVVARHVTPAHRLCWLFGVFDGHGGTHASEYIAKHWPRLLFSMLDIAGSECCDEKVQHALRASIRHCNDLLHADLLRSGTMTLEVGTTLCALLVIDGARLFSANVGDSRALAVRSNGALHSVLTHDHKPSRADERQRIRQLGGFVSNVDGVDRVMGNLSVSRALGDFHLVPFVSGEPAVSDAHSLHGVGALVVCCDGVTDVLSNEKIARIAAQHAASGGPQRAAEAVRAHAYDNLSGDNLSVLVVNLASRA